MGKTKVLRCSDEPSVAKESGKFPCAICSKGVGSNSVCCAKCKMRVHKKFSGVKGRLKVDCDYQCKKCSVNGTTVGAESGKKKILLESGESIECVEEFCYLGDMLSCGGGAGEASRVSQVCLEEIQGAVSNTDSKRSIS